MYTMLKKKYILVYSVCILSMLFASCEKRLDVTSGEYAKEELQWESVSDTRSSLMGIYGLLRAAILNNNAHWMYGEMRQGDFTPYDRSDLKAINNHQLKDSYPLIQELTNWRRFYAVINAASQFIERAPEVFEKDSRYTEINMKQDIAQARVIRAFTYFYIVRIWGDVPLLSKSFDNGSFEERPRTSQSTVLTFAENEILESIEDLPFLYGVHPQYYYGENSAFWRKALINKLSAYTVLAHLSAWQGKYLNVDVYTQLILDNYSNIGAQYLNTIDKLTGSVGIFSNNYDYGALLNIVAPYSVGEATATGHIEEMTLAQPVTNKQFPEIYVSKDSISKIFNDINDVRFGIDTIAGLPRTNYFTNYNGETPIFSKIKVFRDGDNEGAYKIYGSNLVFSRLEEIALLRAEAMYVLENPSEAIQLLNRVKSQRKTRPYTSATTTPLIEEIFMERRRELMGEGWRWYDQIREAKIRNLGSEINTMIDNNSIYWPISQSVLDKNTKIDQNEYWK